MTCIKCTALCLLLVIAVFVDAKERDCSVSRTFKITEPQALSGVLKDESGAVLNRLEMELLVGKKVFRKLRTSEEGTYDFGEIPSGTYKIRVQPARGFCAPDVECGTGGCTFRSYLRTQAVALPVKCNAQH